MTAPGSIQLSSKDLQEVLEKYMDDNFGSALIHR